MFLLHGTPGCRLSRHPDATLYPSLDLHVITIDRPGYGESTALPERRVSHAAHDVSAVADELGLERFFVVGGSGGGPHALACAAELGDRVLGCAPVASAAPLIPAEIDGLLGINHKAYQVLAESGREGMGRVPRDASRALPRRSDRDTGQPARRRPKGRHRMESARRRPNRAPRSDDRSAAPRR
jgi:pimeloyl-ACP methyl ester carboxylesterase